MPLYLLIMGSCVKSDDIGYIALHIGCTNGENIVTGCITSLETGIYNVNIFDINNNGQKDSSGTAVIISPVQVLPPSQPSQPTPTNVSSIMYYSIRETPSSTVSYECHVMNLSVNVL